MLVRDLVLYTDFFSDSDNQIIVYDINDRVQELFWFVPERNVYAKFNNVTCDFDVINIDEFKFHSSDVYFFGAADHSDCCYNLVLFNGDSLFYDI